MLAELLGVTHRSLNRWERGHHRPPSFLALALAEIARRSRLGMTAERRARRRRYLRKRRASDPSDPRYW